MSEALIDAFFISVAIGRIKLWPCVFNLIFLVPASRPCSWRLMDEQTHLQSWLTDCFLFHKEK